MNAGFWDHIGEEGRECSVSCIPETRDDGSVSYRYECVTKDDEHHFRDLLPDEQRIARRWLEYNLETAKTVLPHHTSYGMKHVLERRTNVYMSNNAFKELMMLCGFFPAKADELNWRFAVKKTSPMFRCQTDGETGLPMLGEPMRYGSR